MTHVSRPRLVTALFSFVVYFASGDTLVATRLTQAVGVELDRLIPREKWEGTGLNKLTVPEQQTLAAEITALLGAARPSESGTPGGNDRSQWRKLQRHMSKDDVRNLLGEPQRVSVSRFFESWSYLRGTVTFDGKGRLDSWNET